MLLLDSFDLSMIRKFPASIVVEEVTSGQARIMAQANLEPVISNRDVAAVYGNELGLQVRAHPEYVTMVPGDIALVGRFHGHLPPGSDRLPEGVSLQWLLVTVVP
ncbi:MAG: hypothetical protein V1846_01735 [Candidatus Komeilibacteria bacterium]